VAYVDAALGCGIFLWDFGGGLWGGFCCGRPFYSIWAVCFLQAVFWKWGGGMLVTLPEAKEYLRVDAEDEDALILGFIGAAQEICMDVARVSEESDLADDLKNARAAVLYTVAYLYEHREEADHRGLMLTLRALLFGVRREGF
jgi:hypothetical protein